MLIECKLKRQGGSIVDMGDGTTYHFKDDGKGRHIASVSSSAHIGRLLGIAEGYCLFDDQVAAAPAQGLAPAKPVATSNSQDAAPQVQPIQQQATDALVQQVAATVAQQSVDQAKPPAPQPDARDSVDPVAELSEDMPIEKLHEIYLAEIGKAPNGNYKAATLIAKIEAARQAKA